MEFVSRQQEVGGEGGTALSEELQASGQMEVVVDHGVLKKLLPPFLNVLIRHLGQAGNARKGKPVAWTQGGDVGGEVRQRHIPEYPCQAEGPLGLFSFFAVLGPQGGNAPVVVSFVDGDGDRALHLLAICKSCPYVAGADLETSGYKDVGKNVVPSSPTLYRNRMEAPAMILSLDNTSVFLTIDTPEASSFWLDNFLLLQSPWQGIVFPPISQGIDGFQLLPVGLLDVCDHCVCKDHRKRVLTP